jgi:phenylacetic acid degradation operon negative regulatory protein
MPATAPERLQGPDAAIWPVLHAHLRAFAQRQRPRARSLIITVFGDAVLPRGARLWLGSLIQLLAALGVNERLVRTTVYRLVQAGWLTTQAHGRRTDYLLTASGHARFDEAARQIYADRAPRWDMRWRLLLLTAELAPREREALRRSLYWQGYGELPGGVFVHPSADFDTTFDTLRADGLAALHGRLLPLLAERLPVPASAPNQDLVQQAWNLQALGADYAAFVRRYTPLLDELQTAGVPPPALAFCLRTLLIDDWRHLLLRDPQLPHELLPRDWPGEQARQTCRRLYRLLLAQAEQHLDTQLHWADGHVPPAAPWLWQRFAPQGTGCQTVSPAGRDGAAVV